MSCSVDEAAICHDLLLGGAGVYITEVHGHPDDLPSAGKHPLVRTTLVMTATYTPTFAKPLLVWFSERLQLEVESTPLHSSFRPGFPASASCSWSESAGRTWSSRSSAAPSGSRLRARRVLVPCTIARTGGGFTCIRATSRRSAPGRDQWPIPAKWPTSLPWRVQVFSEEQVEAFAGEAKEPKMCWTWRSAIYCGANINRALSRWKSRASAVKAWSVTGPAGWSSGRQEEAVAGNSRQG